MDLDDEELEATRKLNGTNRKNGRDINVGSIEKDIKRCEQLTSSEHANWIGISNQLAIAGVLAERKQDKARIKELEEKLLDMVEGTKFIKKETAKETLEYIKENYIPVKKVKEILDKAEVMDYYTLPDVIEDLEKLLEDK